MGPVLALNCLLQIAQERSEEESSVGDALPLSFGFARFCLASLILFASYSPAPLLMRPRHFVRFCAIMYNVGKGPCDFMYNVGKGPCDFMYNVGKDPCDFMYNVGKGPCDFMYNVGKGPCDFMYNV